MKGESGRPEQIRVMLLARGQLMLDSLARLLTAPGVIVDGRFETREGALAAIADTHPDLIVLRSSPPELEPGTFFRYLRNRLGDDAPPVVVIKRQLDSQAVTGPLSLGAKGYLNPDTLDGDDFHAILPVVCTGFMVLGPEASKILTDNLRHITPVSALALSEASLTPREAEVLGLLAEGLLNKEIAARLGIGVRTVEMHVAKVVSKLGARSRAEVMVRAWRISRVHHQN